MSEDEQMICDDKQLVKIVGEIVRQAAEWYVAGAGNDRVWDQRKYLVERIGQSAEADFALVVGGTEASKLAVRGQWLALANQRHRRTMEARPR